MSASVLAVNVAVAERIQTRPRRDLSIDYLRTMITVGVLLHHSMLAYATWAVVPQGNLFRAFVPMVDSTRWSVIDYIIGFNDNFFMVLMFFISGLFVYPAMRKHGIGGFVRERFRRLGIPFLFAIFVVNPIGYYIPWLISGHPAGFIQMYRELAASGFSPGPAWFIWLLLTMDLGMAMMIKLLNRPPFTRLAPALKDFTARMGDHPFEIAIVMFFATALVYIPMLYHFGYDQWTAIITPPFLLQISRLFLYPLWFAFGVLVGAWGLSRGLLYRASVLARYWPYWIMTGLVIFNMAWLFRVLAISHPFLSAHSRSPITLLWVACCVCSILGIIGMFSHIQWSFHPWMHSLNRCAYGIYLVHYMFIAAVQRLFLDQPIHPAIKILTVFFITVVLSWLTTSLLLRIPRVKTIL